MEGLCFVLFWNLGIFVVARVVLTLGLGDDVFPLGGTMLQFPPSCNMVAKGVSEKSQNEPSYTTLRNSYFLTSNI
jgi:hypothetical protein